MSDWQDRANKRRDERHTKEPDAQVAKPKASKKDTKRWCKGKEGREHKTEVRSYKDAKGVKWAHDGWFILICTACGKELDRYWPLGLQWANEPPEWLKTSGLLPSEQGVKTP